MVLVPAWTAVAQQTPVPKWAPHIDVEGKAGTKRNLGEADLFIPLAQDADTLLFTDIRTRMDDADGLEGNFGLGVRHMLDNGWNLGTYAYYDRRKTEWDNYFSQVTLGLEALSQDWDLRGNLYLPQGSRTHLIDALSTAEISGTSVIFRGGEEKSLSGFDAEIGWRVPLFDAQATQQLRVYGGGYRFTAADVPDISGPRLRAELTFDDVPGLWAGSRFSLGAEWQHDEPRGSQGFLSARLRIPFQTFARPSSDLTPMERRMTDPIVRDVDIVSQSGAFGAAEVATATADGKTITVINSASTSGANLATAVTAAGANSAVILSGTFNTGATTVVMQAGQSLLGSGAAVRSPSGRTAVLTNQATVNMNGTISAITMVNNTTVSGLTISGTHTSAPFVLDAQNRSNVTITNNTITATDNGGGAVALDLRTTSNAVVRGNTLTARGGSSGGTAVMAGSATNLTFAGNTIDAAGSPATAVNGNNFLTIINSTGNILVSGTCTGGPYGSGSISFTNGTACQ